MADYMTQRERRMAELEKKREEAKAKRAKEREEAKALKKAETKTKSKSKKRKKSKAKAAAPRLSYLVKPIDMTLEEWQRALRVQAAERDSLIVKPISHKDRPGYYEVSKVIYEKPDIFDDEQPTVRKIKGYGDKHQVVFRGDGSQWNYCSCLDFKTSGLGTCKHIEAVKRWIESNGKRVNRTLPDASSVYVDYKDGRKIKIRIGAEESVALRNLAKGYFDENDTLLPMETAQVYEFLMQARSICPSFRWYADVINQLSQQSMRKQLQELSRQIDDTLLESLMRTKLYPYQKEGIRFAFAHGRSIIADEMGLGKTVQAIGYAELLRHFQLATSAIIVCPTSLKYQWKHEIEKFTGANVMVVEGDPLKRNKIYASPDAFYKVVSYNAIANDIRVQGHMDVDLLIMDEVQRLKNWDTNIAKAARRISSQFSVILSGTPLENKLEELYSIVELVDQYFLSPYYKFRNDYIVTDAAGMTIGYKNLNDIGERLSDILIRRRKCEVALQMPARTDQTIYVEMTKEQRALHDEAEYQMCQIVSKWRSFHFISEQDRMRLMLFLGQMRMAANSTFIFDQRTRHDTKIAEAINIVSDVVESGDQKIVIFSGWERMTRILAAELDAIGIKYANLNGKVPSVKRKQLIEDFSSDPECRVFLSTDAGATGLNLQAGSIIINMELPWNPAVLEQRIGRIYRLGQQRNIQVINFVSLNSIEMQIETKIKFKSALFEGILDDGSDSVFLPDKSKMDELLESLSASLEEKEKAKNENPDDSEDAVDDADEPEREVEDVEAEDITDQELKLLDEYSSDEEEEEVEDEDSGSGNDEETSEESNASEANDHPENVGGTGSGSHSPQELVQQGLSFFASLADTLQSPEKTQQLVESIVKTDETTGQTSLNIPIPNKESVTNILSLFGALLSNVQKIS